MNGIPEQVLVLDYSDFVGWIRFEGNNAVWRFGSLRTGGVSQPRFAGSLDMTAASVIDWITAAVREVSPVLPPADPAEGEAEHFIRCIESGQRPLAWSRTIPANIAKATPSTLPVPVAHAWPPAPRQPVVEYDPFIHTMVRYPAARGFTEQQLDGVPLITVHPAVIPAVIGGIFLFLGLLGTLPYTFYAVLRWPVFAMAIWICVVASGQKRTGWVVVFACMAALFNPFFPYFSTREFWVFPDFLGAILFGMAGGILRASRPGIPK